MKVSEVKYPTPIEKDMEKAIRDRLFSGFNNWNGGYDGWLKWCDTLYEPDACYNIPLRGAQKRLILQEYKACWDSCSSTLPWSWASLIT